MKTSNKIIIIPASIPGCAKKLVVLSSVLSIINTSPPECVFSLAGLPVDGFIPLDWFGSKSISVSSSVCPGTTSERVLSTGVGPQSDEHKWRKKKEEINYSFW